MHRIIFLLGFLFFAFVLVILQLQHGVTTDEAKYLLNIPYPHPPLLRGILGMTKAFSFQEYAWRTIFAIVMVLGVIPIFHATNRSPLEQHVIPFLWVLSGAFVLYTGTILMAPANALQGLLFVYLLLQSPNKKLLPWVALLWFVSLFTAYQAVLYAPLAIGIFWKNKASIQEWACYFILPVLALGMYSLSNPFSLASMLRASDQNSAVSSVESLWRLVQLWALGGSIVVSLFGTWGMIRAKNIWLGASLILVSAYVFLSYQPYYAILFTPLFIGGLLVSQKIPSLVLLFLTPIISIGFLTLTDFTYNTEVPFSKTAQANIAKIPDGPLMINGYFGHDWQYQTPREIMRFTESKLNDAAGVLCLSECEYDFTGWQKMMIGAKELYYR